MTFYSILLGIWGHQTTELYLACSSFMVPKGMQHIWAALLHFSSPTFYFLWCFYFLSFSFYFFGFEIFLLGPVHALLM